MLMVSAAALAAQKAAPCERPACLPGARWDGRECRFERPRPGSGGYSPSCGAGATLDSTRGVCVVPKCAKPVSGGPSKPSTDSPPTITGRPISGGTPGSVAPRAAPLAGVPAPLVRPAPADSALPPVNLSVYAGDTRSTEVVCEGGIHGSPVFRLEVSNGSPAGTGGPVRIRAIDSGRPEVFRDTVLAPLGALGRVRLGWWKVQLPRDLRYGADFVRDFDVIVDPDHRLGDPDRRNNVARVRKILILCW